MVNLPSCPKCKQIAVIDDYFDFKSHRHPVYYCDNCVKYFAFFGNMLIQSSDKEDIK